MKLASTTGDFRGYAKTTADAVRFYEETGFRHLDYSFYIVIQNAGNMGIVSAGIGWSYGKQRQ